MAGRKWKSSSPWALRGCVRIAGELVFPNSWQFNASDGGGTSRLRTKRVGGTLYEAFISKNENRARAAILARVCFLDQALYGSAQWCQPLEACSSNPPPLLFSSIFPITCKAATSTTVATKQRTWTLALFSATAHRHLPLLQLSPPLTGLFCCFWKSTVLQHKLGQLSSVWLNGKHWFRQAGC